MPLTAEGLRVALRNLDALRYYAGDDIEDALGRIVAATHDLFGVDGAALMLVDTDLTLRNAAVSDSRFDHLERLQEISGVGPCVTAYETREVVAIDDLRRDDRWKPFAEEAAGAGLRSLLVTPIPYTTDALGVLAVFSRRTHRWRPQSELALRSFTDLAAYVIAATMRSEVHSRTRDELLLALDARVVIEQAKGVLVEREGLTPRDAFDRLRTEARRTRRKIKDLATEVVRDAGQV